MRALTMIALVVAGIGLGSTSAAGQAPETDGLWWGAGAGYALLKVNCQICTNSIRGGPSAHLKMGGKLSRSVLFGAEAGGWIKRIEDVDQYVLSLHAMGYWYMDGTPGLFLKGGIGPTWYLANERGDDDDLSSLGVSIQLGAGYETRIGSRTSLTPTFTLVGSGFGKLSVQDQVASSSFGVAQASFAISVVRY